MIIFITLMLLIVVVAIGFMSFVSYRSKQNIIARMAYGFTVVEQGSADIDLSAGDYGMIGKARFFYQLRAFLSTNYGRILMVIVGALTAAAGAFSLGKPLSSIVYTAPLGGILLLLVGLGALAVHKRDQAEMVRAELPNALQTLAAIMEGGIAFETALSHVLHESDPAHPLYFELGIMTEAMQRGRRRAEALKLWSDRSDNQAVKELVSGLLQADTSGASLGQVLKHHGESLLREHETTIQRRAERLPVRMLMPMATMILPSVMIVAAGPSMVRVIQMIEAIMRNA